MAGDLPPEEEAAHKERLERIKKCAKEMQEVLNEFNCELRSEVTINSSGQVEGRVQIIAK